MSEIEASNSGLAATLAKATTLLSDAQASFQTTVASLQGGLQAVDAKFAVLASGKQ